MGEMKSVGESEIAVSRYVGKISFQKLVLFSKYNYSDQVKKDEIGGACSRNAGEEECI
jgi:hypothetical protein